MHVCLHVCMYAFVMRACVQRASVHACIHACVVHVCMYACMHVCNVGISAQKLPNKLQWCFLCLEPAQTDRLPVRVLRLWRCCAWQGLIPTSPGNAGAANNSDQRQQLIQGIQALADLIVFEMYWTSWRKGEREREGQLRWTQLWGSLCSCQAL